MQKKIYKMLKPNLNELGKLAKDTHIETKKYFDKLKKKTPKNLDYVMQDLHDAESKKTDCLECANCCKTTGPLFTSADIFSLYPAFPYTHNETMASGANTSICLNICLCFCSTSPTVKDLPGSVKHSIRSTSSTILLQLCLYLLLPKAFSITSLFL